MITTAQRQITPREQFRCSFDNCLNPATHGCTDSIIANGERKQSPMRHGCQNPEHRVTPRYQRADGTFISWEQHIAEENGIA